jgi:CheY-like chemotaxis protein
MMNTSSPDKMPPIVILMADDSETDCLLARESFAEHGLLNDFRTVGDGQELLDYLRHEGRYQDAAEAPLPGLILLDLGMPHKTGYEVLREIKADPQLSRIPVIILTISPEESDKMRSYDLGAEGFMNKPVEFDKLVTLIQDMSYFWIEMVASSASGNRVTSPHQPLFQTERRFSGDTLIHQDRAFRNEIAQDRRASASAAKPADDETDAPHKT